MRPALGLAPFLLASALAGAAIAQPPPDGPQAGAPDAPAPPSPQMLEARRAVRAQCAADIARLCPEAPEGSPPSAENGDPGAGAGAAPGGRHGGRRWGAMRCLREHRSEVAPPCAEALDALRATRLGAGASPPG